MRKIFTFDTVAVVVRHWFEIDLGDGSMEHGARVEISGLEPHPHEGTESAGQRLTLGFPFWRADLFDRVGSEPGAFDAAHFHPRFDGIEPCSRVWDDTLTADPWQWLAARMSDLAATLATTGRTPSEHDVSSARRSADDVVAAAQGVAATRCGSVAECHEQTRDVIASIRLMVTNLADPSKLDRAHVAPWLAEGVRA